MNRWQHYSSYLIMGGLTTLVNLLAYKGFLELGLDYRIAVTLAIFISVLFAFFSNRKIVFHSHGNLKKEMILFFLLRALAYLINMGGLIALVEWAMMDEFYGQVVMNIIIVLLNYVLSRFLVFERVTLVEKEKDSHESRP